MLGVHLASRPKRVDIGSGGVRINGLHGWGAGCRLEESRVVATPQRSFV